MAAGPHDRELRGIAIERASEFAPFALHLRR
jgi:hypothetical protein